MFHALSPQPGASSRQPEIQPAGNRARLSVSDLGCGGESRRRRLETFQSTAISNWATNMDRPERMQAAGDASRRQSTPGAAPEPGQAAFRGRRVAEVPGAGSSPSRSEPRATRATTGVSGSPGGPVSREAGRAGHRFQPYSAGEAGRPGASHLPAGEPSVPRGAAGTRAGTGTVDRFQMENRL